MPIIARLGQFVLIRCQIPLLCNVLISLINDQLRKYSFASFSHCDLARWTIPALSILFLPQLLIFYSNLMISAISIKFWISICTLYSQWSY
jgi:hypothetical protein